MGWFNENAPGHEGYVIGLVESVNGETWSPAGTRLRRLGTGDKAQKRVPFVQVACDCGWRSKVFSAPIGTEFWPSTVDLPSGRSEERARAIWRLHADDDTSRIVMNGGVL